MYICIIISTRWKIDCLAQYNWNEMLILCTFVYIRWTRDVCLLCVCESNMKYHKNHLRKLKRNAEWFHMNIATSHQILGNKFQCWMYTFHLEITCTWTTWTLLNAKKHNAVDVQKRSEDALCSKTLLLWRENHVENDVCLIDQKK